MENRELAVQITHIDDEAFLRELNSLIISKLKHLHTVKQMSVALHFRVGETVTFDSKRGRITGKITKINKKTIVVNEAFTHTSWKVSPSMLKKVEV